MTRKRPVVSNIITFERHYRCRKHYHYEFVREYGNEKYGFIGTRPEMTNPTEAIATPSVWRQRKTRKEYILWSMDLRCLYKWIKDWKCQVAVGCNHPGTTLCSNRWRGIQKIRHRSITCYVNSSYCKHHISIHYQQFSQSGIRGSQAD